MTLTGTRMGTAAPSSASLPGSGADVFQLLRDGRPRTRAELGSATGLPRAKVAARVDVLLALGLIAPVSGSVSSGGRPPSLLAFRPSARLVLAADLGATHATIAITDLAGVSLAEVTEALDIAEGPETVLLRMVTTARRLVQDAGRDASDVVAVGIGLPGPVEHSTGTPYNPPIMPGWNHFDVPGFVRRHLDVPVLVDNDVNIMALGERAAGWPDVQHLIFVKVATGIGAGVISGGVLQRGAQGIAGDIGHVRIPRAADVQCHCGNSGCLEAVASGSAIAAALRLAGYEVETGGELVELVRQGNRAAVAAVRQAGRDLGEVLTACVSLINPSVLVIGGTVAQVGEHLLAGVREVVYTRSMPLATEYLSIVQSRAGGRAGVLGASMLAVDHVLSPQSIDLLASRVVTPLAH